MYIAIMIIVAITATAVMGAAGTLLIARLVGTR